MHIFTIDINLFFIIIKSRNLTVKEKGYYEIRGRHGRDRMVVGLITTYAISAYHL